MALNRPVTIRIKKPEDALAETMAEMRAWFDKHRVQPAVFKIAMTETPGIAFDVQFQSEEDAVLFERFFRV